MRLRPRGGGGRGSDGGVLRKSVLGTHALGRAVLDGRICGCGALGRRRDCVDGTAKQEIADVKGFSSAASGGATGASLDLSLALDDLGLGPPHSEEAVIMAWPA